MTNRKEEYDVVIIGGGPAGLGAGIALAGQGLRTLVCEKKRLPVDKPCGEGVMPAGVEYLRRLGVARHLSAHDICAFTGIRYHAPSGRMAEGRFAHDPGWGIRRTALSRALAARAAEMDTLEILDGAAARPVERQDHGITVLVDGREVCTRLLVGADGLHSGVRRWAGLQGPPPARQRWGARQHFAVSPWPDRVEVYWSHGLEAYLTPCGVNLVGLAFLWDRRDHPRLPGGQALIPGLLGRFPALERRLGGAQPCSQMQAVGPLQQNVLTPVADGMLLIGDAAGYLDALTGEGISLAAAQALCMADTVAPVVKEKRRQGGIVSARELAPYAQAYQRIMKPYHRITRLALFFSRRPALAEGMVRVLGRWPGVFGAVVSR